MKTVKKIFIFIIILLFIILVIFIQFFKRIPDRIIPQGRNIISPANGEIIDIKTISNNEVSFFKGDIKNRLFINDIKPPYNIIIIQMNLKNVHVQRSPISGRVIYQEHISGEHRNALISKNIEYLSNINEKNIIIVKNNDIKVGVIQVAGIMARRIVSFVSEGEILEKGDIYGRIKLGSQVVLIIPQEVNVISKIGDILIDGETIIANY